MCVCGPVTGVAASVSGPAASSPSRTSAAAVGASPGLVLLAHADAAIGVECAWTLAFVCARADASPWLEPLMRAGAGAPLVDALARALAAGADEPVAALGVPSLRALGNIASERAEWAEAVFAAPAFATSLAG